MYYNVKARLIPETAADLYRKLTDGTLLAQKPDGQEIIDSMERARIDDSGVVRWSEICFCSTPLAHERHTVLDDHFTELETEETSGHHVFEGQSLMEIFEQAE